MSKCDIKKLLIRSILFAAVFFALDRIFGHVFYFLEHRALQNSPNGMITEYTMEEVDSEVVIMGASEALHSYVSSILEDSLELSVYNCGKDGRRFYYQNAMVNGILDRYAPKLVIWSVSPNFLSSPSQEDKDAISDLNPWYRSNKFCHDAILMKSEFEGLKMQSYLYAFNSRLYAYLYKCIMPDYAYQYGGYSPVTGEMRGNALERRNYSDDLDLRCAEVLRTTLKRCSDNGTKVVFVLTPRYEIGNYKQVSQFEELEKIVHESNMDIIIDLFQDEELIMPKLFRDMAHFNHRGAVAFSKKLANKINQKLK